MASIGEWNMLLWDASRHIFTWHVHGLPQIYDVSLEFWQIDNVHKKSEKPHCKDQIANKCSQVYSREGQAH